MLETDRLLLRYFIPSDWHAIHAILSDHKVVRHLDFSAWSEKQLRAWFDQCIEASMQNRPQTHNWAIILKESHTIIGWFSTGKPDITTIKRDWTFQCALHHKYQGLGYMTEVLEAVFAYEFTLNGINRISGTCEAEDMASIRMMEKAGMTYEGTFTDADSEDKSINRRRYAIHQKEYFLK